MAKKKVTISEFLAAMEANEITKVQGQLVKRDANGAIVGACAYGQAALHLGVDAEDLYTTIQDWARNNGVKPLLELVGTNDSTDSTVPAMARYYRTQVPYWALGSSVTVESKF